MAFGLDWANLEVEHDKLVVGSTPKSETPEQVRDLALGIIEILDHTPIYRVGIQFFAHYKLEDQAARDKLGWTLVSPKPFEGQLEKPGMRSLKMVGRRPGEEDGSNGLIVTIEPSYQFAPEGVYINILDQYDVADPSEANVGSGPATDCLKANWDSALERAETIPAEIFSIA